MTLWCWAEGKLKDWLAIDLTGHGQNKVESCNKKFVSYFHAGCPPSNVQLHFFLAKKEKKKHFPLALGHEGLLGMFHPSPCLVCETCEINSKKVNMSHTPERVLSVPHS